MILEARHTLKPFKVKGMKEKASMECSNTLNSFYMKYEYIQMQHMKMGHNEINIYK